MVIFYYKSISFQLVPPYCHRRNAAERAIRSFKDHLIPVLCSTDKAFPMHLWDRLLPQSVITLNMLRIPRINPKLSAATHLDGHYYYNILPMAPPCTIIVAPDTPSRRITWDPPWVKPFPFPFTKDLATESAKQLIHVLLQPQLAVPFTQVGNDQMLALEHLVAIFESALPKHGRRITPPTKAMTVIHL
jgi:hypothetical protein